MRIHKEGVVILIVAFIAFLIISLILFWLTNILWLKILVSISLTTLFFFIVWFFRNPVRTTVSEPNDIVAPVDGKVVVIKKVFEKEYLKKEVIQVSIFMSPLNVHVCRYPLSGEVVYTKYHPGKYLVAFHPKSSELNERTTVVVNNKGREVLFRQIAGALARRIVLYAEPKHIAKAGKEYGFIKFGSRLDVFLPVDSNIKVELGQITKGGVDIIAHLAN